ncbi:MAG: hypothetical protein ACE366_10635 [Bradymonadia bacterium]
MANEQDSVTFNVTFGTEVEAIVGHHEAVARAKSLSSEHQGRVLVERVDGIVTMNFSHGQLDSYVYETRERRRGDSRNDRRRDENNEAKGDEAEAAAEEAPEAAAEEAPKAETAEAAEA